jgi:hypothetical protein
MFPNVYRPDPDGTSQKGTAYARLRKIRQYLQ